MLPCDQIWLNFGTWATLGYFIPYLKELFQTWLMVGILRFQKCFDVKVSGNQIKHLCRFLGIFDYFIKNWVKFYSIFWSHCLLPLPPPPGPQPLRLGIKKYFTAVIMLHHNHKFASNFENTDLV